MKKTYTGSLLVLLALACVRPVAAEPRKGAEKGAGKGVEEDAGPPPAVEPASELLAPIPEPWIEAFGGIDADPHPEKLTRNSHYWVSDEQRHDLFRQAITNTGGVFIGLGTDQNYLMAGWARPQVLIPLDFDQMIVYLHYVFRVVFLNAPGPDEFVAMWHKDRQAATRSLVEKAYADRDEKFQKGVQRAFKVARRFVYRRLKRISRSFEKLGVPTYLDDQQQYRYVVELFKTNRVFPVRGDLTASVTVKQVGEAARKAGLKVGTLYLSNAEQYFKYTNSYKENMLSLPFDEGSVVIRTAGKRTEWSADGLYEYVVQTGQNFHAWLRSPRTYNVWTIVNARKVDKRTGGSVVTRLPPEEQEK